MFQVLDRSSVKILFAGKQFGNVSERFSSDGADAAFKRRQQLIDELGKEYVVDLNAKGQDTIIDVKNLKLEPGWNVVAGDGLISDRSDVALVLLPADCIPLVIYSVSSPVFGLIHVGRTGAELGIHLAAVRCFINDYGQSVTDLRFYLGLAVDAKSYYFSENRIQSQYQENWQQFVEHKNNQYHIDIPGFVKHQLMSMGVKADQYEQSDIDTGSDQNYYSHSRSVRTGEPEGRNTFAVSHV